MKNFFAVTLAVVLVLSLFSACKKGDDSTDDSTNGTTASQQMLTADNVNEYFQFFKTHQNQLRALLQIRNFSQSSDLSDEELIIFAVNCLIDEQLVKYQNGDISLQEFESSTLEFYLSEIEAASSLYLGAAPQAYEGEGFTYNAESGGVVLNSTAGDTQLRMGLNYLQLDENGVFSTRFDVYEFDSDNDLTAIDFALSNGDNEDYEENIAYTMNLSFEKHTDKSGNMYLKYLSLELQNV